MPRNVEGPASLPGGRGNRCKPSNPSNTMTYDKYSAPGRPWLSSPIGGSARKRDAYAQAAVRGIRESFTRAGHPYYPYSYRKQCRFGNRCWYRHLFCPFLHPLERPPDNERRRGDPPTYDEAMSSENIQGTSKKERRKRQKGRERDRPDRPQQRYGQDSAHLSHSQGTDKSSISQNNRKGGIPPSPNPWDPL